MTAARARALFLIVAALIAAAALTLTLKLRGPAHAVERPTLLLITSLPLVFNEQFSLQGGGSPALRALETRYRVVPISVTDEKDLSKGRLLLMAHPLAQPAEDLVALDDWVRHGGRLLLLADPMLEWPSSRPLGDPLRPPAMFMDTGLLRHWGLQLDGPEDPRRAHRKMGGYDIVTISPGSLSGDCDLSADRLIARCAIGEGRVTVVADADFLDEQRMGDEGAHNLDGLLGELARL